MVSGRTCRTGAVALCITNLFKTYKIIWSMWEVTKERLTLGGGHHKKGTF